jgi:muramoyltetrapeptide carboxypeptidase LdcA involved in peptidoglycan recycling
VGYMLRNYGTQGIFGRLAGLLIGRARGYTAEQKAELEQIAVRIVRDEFGHPDLPIVTNLEFGHTDPQHILPLGVPIAIDCDRQTLELLEPACVPRGD